MILVFDLDDTLYNEMTYVKSSFIEVSNYLSSIIPLTRDQIFNEILKFLKENGRGKVFDILLKKYGYYSKTEVRNCLRVYRNNFPKIKLFEEASDCLERFSNFTKYLVTDGNKLVQRNKIKALDLQKYFKKTIPTHQYGIDKAKPSTFVFHKIINWEKTTPENLVYIGDNPNKDFINLKKEGFKTIRVLTGNFKDLKLSPLYEAHIQIESLNDLTTDLINQIKSTA